MVLRVLEIDPADTFYSVRDRLLQGGRGRAVLVLPARGAPIGPVELILLRRLADRERLDIGLVTADRETARRARVLGLPAFSSLTLAEHYRPGWWRAGRRAERIGFAPGEDHRLPARIAAESAGSRRGVGVLVLLLGALALGLSLVALLYFAPYAVVTLRPQTEPVQIIADLTADPTLSEPTGSALPARPIELNQAWETVGSNADREQLRAAARQQLGASAPAIIAARLVPGEALVPNSVDIDITNETFRQTQQESILALDAVLSGWVVQTAQLDDLARGRLAEALPAGFAPQPDSLSVRIEPANGSPPEQLQMTAQATGRAAIDPATTAAALQGKPIPEVRRYLTDGLPATDAALAVGPGWWRAWFGRLPLRADRIRVEFLP